MPCPRYFYGTVGIFLELRTTCLLSAACWRQERVVEQHYPSLDILICLEKADEAVPT